MHYLVPALTLPTVPFASTAVCAAPTSDSSRGFLMKTVEVSGKQMKYVVYVPSAYKPGKPMPTVVFLNGAGECGTDGLKQACIGLGSAVMMDMEKWPFIVVFPQKQDVKTKWEDEDPMVMAIIDKTKRELSVDESRLYLTGLSQGGHGTWTIGAMHADLFAAIAPVCGWADEDTAKKLAKMPIWVFHGDADEAVKVSCSQDMATWLKAAGNDCKLTIYPGVGHNSWDNAYRNENLGQWFLEHQRSR